MQEYLDLGTTTPNVDDGAMVGWDDYGKWARIESLVLREQLVREKGDPPAGVRFGLRRNDHDFGCYYTLAVYYDDSDDEQVEYAFKCEEGVYEWDNVSMGELECKGYFTYLEEQRNTKRT